MNEWWSLEKQAQQQQQRQQQSAAEKDDEIKDAKESMEELSAAITDSSAGIEPATAKKRRLSKPSRPMHTVSGEEHAIPMYA